MEPASTDDSLGYAAPWMPVGSMPGWVYAPTVPDSTWGAPGWCGLPVASVRLGVQRTPRRHRYSVRNIIPAWLAAAWAALLGGRPETVRRVDLRRAAAVQSYIEALYAVTGLDGPVHALLDAAHPSA